MSFHDRLGQAALRDGNTPEQFRAAAQKHANAFWFYVVAVAAVWYLADWRWALIPLVVAVLKAVQSVSSTLTARKLDALSRHGGSPSLVPALPETIDLDDVLHVTIIDEIREKYSDLLANDSGPYASCMYRPASLLPFPKATIRRALQALVDFAEGRRNSTLLDKSLRAPAAAETLRTALALLDDFLEVSTATLPTDPRQNALVGSRIPRQ